MIFGVIILLLIILFVPIRITINVLCKILNISSLCELFKIVADTNVEEKENSYKY